jgi:hypothetical protein
MAVVYSSTFLHLTSWGNLELSLPNLPQVLMTPWWQSQWLMPAFCFETAACSADSVGMMVREFVFAICFRDVIWLLGT